MASRRSVLIGLGSLVAGGGALLGTGAFTTVTAERNVSVETTGDASAFLSLEPATGANGNFVTTEGGTIQFNLDSTAAGNATTNNGTGLNQNAKTTLRNLVTVTNNGTQEITSLTLEMTDDSNNTNAGNVFKFTTSVDASATLDNSGGGADILGTGSNEVGSDGSLATGTSVTFGLIIDLINNSLGSNSYTLTITAETSNSQ